MSDQKLVSTLKSTINTIQANSENAKVVFRAKTELLEGVKCKAEIRHFSLDVDEPEVLGGYDTAPNPVELVLAALGTCQEILYSAYASMQGIPLSSVKVNVKGNLDLRGLFGLDENVPAGFQEITYETTIKSPAETSVIEKLVQTVENNCPVLDTLTRSIHVKGNVDIIHIVQEEKLLKN